MIISHKYRYLFVELQRTASWAIRDELKENYSGEEILKKNSTYHAFCKKATDAEKNYFVFSGIRNPLDRTISFYEKLKHDPKNYISRIAYKKSKTLADRYFLKQYEFVKKNKASFSRYLKKFYYLPYDDRSCMNHDSFDFVYRFENLQDDFAEILHRIGIDPVRPLPIVNKTKGKSSNLRSYLDEDAVKHAVRVFGPFMEKWGYMEPFDERTFNITGFDRFRYRCFCMIRRFYYKHMMSM